MKKQELEIENERLRKVIENFSLNSASFYWAKIDKFETENKRLLIDNEKLKKELESEKKRRFWHRLI